MPLCRGSCVGRRNETRGFGGLCIGVQGTLIHGGAAFLGLHFSHENEGVGPSELNLHVLLVPGGHQSGVLGG